MEQKGPNFELVPECEAYVTRAGARPFCALGKTKYLHTPRHPIFKNRQIVGKKESTKVEIVKFLF